MASWHDTKIGGLLLDITGVLYNSGDGDGVAIQGSVDAVNRLRSAGFPVRFCTNETTCTPDKLCEKLCRLGFTMSVPEIFQPAPAVCHILKERKLRPHLLVHPGLIPCFKDVDTHDPNCVVLGDAAHDFSYENMNKAFQVLLQHPLLFSLGRGKYYKENDELCLDVGAYMKALEYACDVEAEIVGKPSPLFFNTAIESMELTSDEVVMIGDDVVNDVGGAQACGMRGVLVRTGKYRPCDENHPGVTPSGIVNNLAHAVDLILGSQQQCQTKGQV